MRYSEREKEEVEIGHHNWEGGGGGGGGGGGEHRRVLKKGNIGRDKVSMCIKRVVAITLLKSGITEEDILRGFG